jgi:hypothetical protein
LFVGALLCASLVSLYLGQDANWDLQNYHFYNPYAFINDRIDWDIAPAQLQSYHNPLADIPFYWAVRADLPPQSIAILLALPAGVAWFFLFLSLERLFGSSGLPRSRAYVPLGLLIGVTGTAGVSLIGTTTNDWPAAMLVVIAIWLLLISSRMTHTKKIALISLAGSLAGFAVGLKLTSAPYAAALCLGLLLTVRPFRYHAIACAAVCSALALVGFLATSGFWMLRMYEKFGNPIFPYFNDWFRSPWWYAIPLGSGYGPQSLAEWAVFPFRLFRYNTGIVGELAFRDWRIPFVFAAAALALVAFGFEEDPHRKRGRISSTHLGMAIRRRVLVLVVRLLGRRAFCLSIHRSARIVFGRDGHHVLLLAATGALAARWRSCPNRFRHRKNTVSGHVASPFRSTFLCVEFAQAAGRLPGVARGGRSASLCSTFSGRRRSLRGGPEQFERPVG